MWCHCQNLATTKAKVAKQQHSVLGTDTLDIRIFSVPVIDLYRTSIQPGVMALTSSAADTMRNERLYHGLGCLFASTWNFAGNREQSLPRYPVLSNVYGLMDSDGS